MTDEMGDTLSRESTTEEHDSDLHTMNHHYDNDSEPLLSVNSNSSSSGNFKYEEFSGKLKVKCPTCKGKGKLSQSQSESMVALIPVRDKRLRPRKTKLYLGITMVISIICIVLIAFFLLPRSVTFSIIKTKTIKIFMPDSDESQTIPYIDVEITYLLNNHNYFEARVNDLSTVISWNKFILNTTFDDFRFNVPGRTNITHTIASRQVFSDPEVSEKVKVVCINRWNLKLLEKFVSTARVVYLSRGEEVSHTYFGYTQCINTTSLR